MHFGKVDVDSKGIHESAQQRLREIGRKLGYRTILEYEVPDLVTIGRRSFIDVVWASQGKILAAFEIRTKKRGLYVVTTRKDQKKLKNLIAEEKFIVNVSKISGKAYFHRLTEKPAKKYTFKEVRRIHPRAYKEWTEDEDHKLLAQYKMGISISELAKTHQRKTGAIRSRLAKLGFRVENG